MVLSGPNNINKMMITEFLRGISLCHQVNVAKTNRNGKITYIGVQHDEIASLDFCQ